MQFRVTTLRYRPKEAVPIEPNQQRHISTDGVKTTAGATGQPGAPAPKNKKKPKKRRSIIGMIFSFIGCMLCLCIMAASVGGVLHPLDAPTVRRAFFGTPLMTLGVIFRIHWQALRLWAKRVPFHGKPSEPKRFVTR